MASFIEPWLDTCQSGGGGWLAQADSNADASKAARQAGLRGRRVCFSWAGAVATLLFMAT
jgi:hypothetical protein